MFFFFVPTTFYSTTDFPSSNVPGPSCDQNSASSGSLDSRADIPQSRATARSAAVALAAASPPLAAPLSRRQMAPLEPLGVNPAVAAAADAAPLEPLAALAAAAVPPPLEPLASLAAAAAPPPLAPLAALAAALPLTSSVATMRHPNVGLHTGRLLPSTQHSSSSPPVVLHTGANCPWGELAGADGICPSAWKSWRL